MTFPAPSMKKNPHYGDATRAGSGSLERTADCRIAPVWLSVTSDDSNNPSIIAASARAAVELGADVIKTRFTGSPEDRLIVEAAGVPVLALGGPKPASTVTSNLFSTVCRWVRKAWL